MRRMHTGIAVVATLVIAAASTRANPVRMHFEIDQGRGSGFGFSVLHRPSNGRGNGRILYRYLGDLEADVDLHAGTVTLTQFQADLFRERNLNPRHKGPRVGSLSLVEGQLTTNADGLLGGQITLSLTLDGKGSGDVTFLFQPIAYNPLANRLDDELGRFGLWGATADMFGQGPPMPIGDTGLTSLGMDLLTGPGTEVMVAVPLPSGVMLGSVGLAGLFGVRRRRRS